MTRRNSKTARIRALRPTTTDTIVRASGIMKSSEQSQRFELRNLLPERRLDAEVQRHVRARTTRAHAGHFHVGGIAVHVHELDVAAVRDRKSTRLNSSHVALSRM